MASYHYSRSVSQRSKGQSSIAHAAYIAGEKIKDERTKITYNFSNRQGFIVAKIYGPEGVPFWVYDRASLWNAVEKFEDENATLRFQGHEDPEKNAISLKARAHAIANAQTAFKVNASLPRELPLEQWQLMVEAFAKRFTDQDIIIDTAIHVEDGNPHVHLIFPTRQFKEGQFAAIKFREMATVSFLKRERKAWEEIGNHYLKINGRDERWTCESYKTLGLEIVPTVHRGWQADSRMRDGLTSRLHEQNQEIRSVNIREFMDQPLKLLQKVAAQKTVFTIEDVQRALMKEVGDDFDLLTVLKGKLEHLDVFNILGRNANNNVLIEGQGADFKATVVKEWSQYLIDQQEVVKLGSGIHARQLLMLKDDQVLEQQVVQHIDTLVGKKGLSVYRSRLDQAIKQVERVEKFTFSEEQLTAIAHLNQEKQLTVLTGQAGTGKTTILKPIVQAYIKQGYRVQATAFQGKVVDMLVNQLNIKGRTLDSFNELWQHIDRLKATLGNRNIQGKARREAVQELKYLEKHDLNAKDLIIVDEGNMVDALHWLKLFNRVEACGAKLMVLQDPAQILALHGMDVSRVLVEKASPAVLQDVRRQHQAWMRTASQHFNKHDIQAGLNLYHEQGALHFTRSFDQLKQRLVIDYVNILDQSPGHNSRILTFKNVDAYELNLGVQFQLQQKQQLGQQVTIGSQSFYIHDQVVFTKNEIGRKVITVKSTEKNKGVKNGSFGTITQISTQDDQTYIHVKLSSGREVKFDPSIYPSLSLAYALTINKAEGETFDRSFVYGDTSMSANQWLIAGTRHKHQLDIYIDGEIAPTLSHLAHLIGRSDARALSTDHSISEQNRPYHKMVENYESTVMSLVEARDLLPNQQEKTESFNIKYKESAKLQLKLGLEDSSSTDPWDHYRTLNLILKDQARDIIDNWTACQPFITQAGLYRNNIEHHAGLMPKAMRQIDIEAQERVGAYRKSAFETRTLWDKIYPKSYTTQQIYQDAATSEHLNFDMTAHPLYQEYVKFKNIRDEIANYIVNNQALHQPYFKYDEIKEGDKTYFVDQVGQKFEQPSFGMRTAIAHSEAYVISQRQDHFLKQASPEQQQNYTLMTAYQKNDQLAKTIFYKMKEIKAEQDQGITTDIMGSVLKQLELSQKEAATQRDLAAYQIVQDYKNFSHLSTILKINETSLLEHASLGEIRSASQQYLAAENIQHRLSCAKQLHTLLYTADGDLLSKKNFAIIKESAVDIGQVKFEYNYSQLKQQDYTLDQLKAAYVDLNAYKEKRQEVKELWTVVRDDTVGHIRDLQNNALGDTLTAKAQRLDLEQDILNQLELKAVNNNVLLQINEQILQVHGGYGNRLSTHFMQTSISKQGYQILRGLHSKLNNHHNLKHLFPEMAEIKNLYHHEFEKVGKAYDFSENHHAVMGALPEYEQKSIKRDATELHFRVLCAMHRDASTLEERLDCADTICQKIDETTDAQERRRIHVQLKDEGYTERQFRIDVGFQDLFRLEMIEDFYYDLDFLKRLNGKIDQYFDYKNEAAQLWGSIEKTSIIHIQALQAKILGNSSEAYEKQVQLQTDVLKKLKTNRITPQVLLEVNKLIFNDLKLETANGSDLQDLLSLQSNLAQGPSSWLTVNQDAELKEQWQQAKSDQYDAAYSIMKNYNKFTVLLPTNHEQEILDDALKIKALNLITNFNSSFNEEKVTYAQKIVRDLSENNLSYKKYLINHIKHLEIPFRAIHLYGAVRLENCEINDVSQLINIYIGANQTSAKILRSFDQQARIKHKDIVLEQILHQEKFINTLETLDPKVKGRFLAHNIFNDVIKFTYNLNKEKKLDDASLLLTAQEIQQKVDGYIQTNLDKVLSSYCVNKDDIQKELYDQLNKINQIGCQFEARKSDYIKEQLRNKSNDASSLLNAAMTMNEVAFELCNTKAYRYYDPQNHESIKKLFSQALKFSFYPRNLPFLSHQYDNRYKRFVTSAYIMGDLDVKAHITVTLNSKKIDLIRDYINLDQEKKDKISRSILKWFDKPYSTYSVFDNFVQNINNSVDISLLCNSIYGQSSKEESNNQSESRNTYDDSNIIVDYKRNQVYINDSAHSAYGVITKHLGTQDLATILDFAKPFIYSSQIDEDSSLDQYITSLGESATDNIYLKAHYIKNQLVLKRSRLQTEWNESRLQKIKGVQELYQKSVPIIRTQAQDYLMNKRALTQHHYKDVRFIEKNNTFDYDNGKCKIYNSSVISFSRNNKDEITAIQLTPLENGARKVNKQGEKYVKPIYGSPNGSFVALQSSQNKDVAFLAEGIETAMSFKEVGITSSIYAGLGISNIANFNRPYKNIIICADWDGPDAHTHIITQENAKKLTAQGYDVKIIWPAQSGQEKLDFNDVLQQQGKYALKKIIASQTEKLDVFESKVQDIHYEDVMKPKEIQNLNSIPNILTQDSERVEEKRRPEITENSSKAEEKDVHKKYSYHDSIKLYQEVVNEYVTISQLDQNAPERAILFAVKDHINLVTFLIKKDPELMEKAYELKLKNEEGELLAPVSSKKDIMIKKELEQKAALFQEKLNEKEMAPLKAYLGFVEEFKEYSQLDDLNPKKQVLHAIKFQISNEAYLIRKSPELMEKAYEFKIKNEEGQLLVPYSPKKDIVDEFQNLLIESKKFRLINHKPEEKIALEKNTNALEKASLQIISSPELMEKAKYLKLDSSVNTHANNYNERIQERSESYSRTL